MEAALTFGIRIEAGRSTDARDNGQDISIWEIPDIDTEWITGNNSSSSKPTGISKTCNERE